jgi:hypothetical protein
MSDVGTLLENLPDVDTLRAQLAEKLRDANILRDLIRVAEKKENREQRKRGACNAK